MPSAVRVPKAVHSSRDHRAWASGALGAHVCLSGSMRASLTDLTPIGLLLVSLVVSACSETTRIFSDPPGATVWINGSPLGETPVKFKARSWSVRPNAYRYRVEKTGYVAREGYLTPRLSVGRIVSAYMSSCMSCFRGFYEFDAETRIVLAEREGALPTGSTIEQVQRLQRLYDAGLISAPELHSRRIELIRASAPGEDRGNATSAHTR